MTSGSLKWVPEEGFPGTWGGYKGNQGLASYFINKRGEKRYVLEILEVVGDARFSNHPTFESAQAAAAKYHQEN